MQRVPTFLILLFCLLSTGCGGCGGSGGGLGSGYEPFVPEEYKKKQEEKKRQAAKPKTVTVDGYVYTTYEEHERLEAEWKRFLINAKSAENLAETEQQWKAEDDFAKNLKIVFTAQKLQTYRSLSDEVDGVPENRMYEIGQLELKAAEDYGERGTLTRRFSLNFYYPDSESGWTLLGGDYHVLASTGEMANFYPGGVTRNLEGPEGFLAYLFGIEGSAEVDE